jgi:short-subunit dehydrogenase
MKKAVIVGASSGIGCSLAKTLAAHGYVVGLAGRRRQLLAGLQAELATPAFIKTLDVAKPAEAMAALRALIREMDGVDLFVISAGTGFENPDLDWHLEQTTIEVNVSGFVAAANVAAEHCQARGTGHIVGISSIAALRGGGRAPAYNASKAFASSYLAGLRQRFHQLRLPIAVTDVQPGFVNTAMAKGPNLFWVASPEKAAEQIFDAIRKRRKHVYVTKRWRLVAWAFKILPDWVYNRL